MAVVTSGTDALFFDLSGSSYQARFGILEQLTYDAIPDEFILTAPDGTRSRFHGFGLTLPEMQRGQLKSVSDPGGIVAQFTYAADGKLSEVIRSNPAAGPLTPGESYLYTYLTSGPNTGQLGNVTLRRLLNGVVTATVRQVDYAYYDGISAFGDRGSLKTAIIKDGAGEVIDTNYYRYYTYGENKGYAPGLKMVFGPQSFARLAAAYADPFAATDDQADDYADLTFEYDLLGRATKEVVQGEGCSVCSSGVGTYTFTYTTSSNADDFDSWNTKTIETLPDGNTNTVYTNTYGQVMLKVFENVTTGEKWRTFSKYDSSGRLVLTAMPSAVSGHDETKADLLDLQNDNYVYLHDAAGLIETASYYTSTTANGYLQGTAIKRGELGSSVAQSGLTYTAQTASATVYPVATATRYRTDTGTGDPQTTNYAYTWHSGTTRVASMTMTAPTVTTIQNGSGTPNAMTTVFDILGRPIWTKDEAGFLTYIEYDSATSSPTKVIRDVDTLRVTDFTGLPSGWATPAGGGLHLVTRWEVDNLGRTVKETDPNGNVDYMVYNDPAHEVRVYTGWQSLALRPTGPTVVMREDRAGSYTETLTMSAAPAIGAGGRPDGTEAVSNVQSLVREYRNIAGQVVSRDEYFNLTGLTYSTSTTLGVAGTHFYRTSYRYDNHGLLNRTLTPSGTIYRTVYDGLERPVSEWVGINDEPSSGFWSPTNPADMVKVREYEYDDPADNLTNGGVGDGNLTKLIEIPGGGAPDRVSRMWYDWRDRQVAAKHGVESSESGSVNRPLVYRDFDNLNQVTKTRVYDADGVAPTTITNGVPDPLSAGLLRAQITTKFDELGRVYRSEMHSVNPADGDVATATLKTDVWFDARGNVVKTLMPGGLVQKAAYDSAGRMTVSYLTDGGSDMGYTDADDVIGDIVLEQSESTLDGNGNVLFTTTRQRFHDATGTGALGSPSSGVGARVSYSANYFDAADRPTATADFGTNGGQSFVRPPVVPPRTDFVLVTGYSYDDAGRLKDVTDPAGRVHRKEYDALGRVTKTIENFVDGVVSDGDDKTTTFTHGPAGMTSLTAHLTGGGVQTTEWVYGVSTTTSVPGDPVSSINSNDIVGQTLFPDATTGAASSTEKETVTVNALGQTLTKKDRNGSTHTLTYDVLGRVVSDAVTELGSGVDGSILRIETAYDEQGNAALITSYDAASGGNIVNQVKREFNGLGQMTKEYQAHGGAVDISITPAVQYFYTPMDGSANHSRLTKIKYPSGYELEYKYTGTLNDAISRLSSLEDASGPLENYDYLGAATVVRRAHSQPKVDLTYIKQTGESNGSAGDQYTGLDRFGRVRDQRWVNTVSGIVLDRFQYGYDRVGNRLFRDNLVNTAFGEAYTYDGLNQLASFQRGTLNPLKTGIFLTPTQSQNWDYDALGNWDGVTTNGTAQTRTHNKQNEITGISGATNPTFDANGNMTGDETGKQFVYDAWNRLVKVKDSGGTTLKTYGYDGIGRRVTETVGSTTTDLFYSAAWQVLEEKIGSNITKRYVWSPVYVDAMILRDRDTNGDGTLDERLWVIQDANWSVTALVDGSGNVVERYTYTPFGVRTVHNASWAVLSGSAYDFGHGHQGLWFDATAGLNEADRRWYSPTLGRWVSLDPILYKGLDQNLYRAMANNPILYVDPDGLQINPVQTFPNAPAWNHAMENKIRNPDGAQELMLGFGGPLAIGAILAAPVTTASGIFWFTFLTTVDGHDNGQLGKVAIAVVGGTVVLRGAPVVFQFVKRCCKGKPPTTVTTVQPVGTLPTGQLSSLPNQGPVLSQFKPGQSGFSGVYDTTTGKWHMQPSGTAQSPPLLANGQAAPRYVEQYGGHATVEAQLRAAGGVSCDQTVGYAVVQNADGTLTVLWNSAINTRNFGSRAVPAEFRENILKALETATGKIVKSE